MCAISGIFDFQHGETPNLSTLEKMMKVLEHRGPDGSGSFQGEGIALGFNRLSFLDLDGGMQPLHNEDSSVTMVCNGEIFNFRELRKDLEAKGHTFRTNTDVETIVHLYDEVGADFPTYLNGQFAVALYDEKRRELFLARDHMGVAPLFYTVRDGKIIFASEIKGILEVPGVPRKLNLKAVDQLMNFPGVVSPTTFFRDIFSLRPGHMLRVTADGARDVEYWDLQFHEDLEDKGEAYYVEKLRELFKASVSRRLVADVPVGFYVSGGLDSSVVACFIGKYLLNSYYSFSAEMESGELDESRFQKIVRDCVKSEHYSVHISEEELWKYLGDVIYHAEAGVKESYDVAAFLLSNLVHGSPAKAVLTGQGSDELFCGYVGYMVDLFRNMQKDQMTSEERETNERLWGDPFFRFERNHPALRQIHRKVYSADVAANLDSFDALKESPINVERVRGLSSQKRRSYIDCKLRLADHLLGEHGDRMIFSHSVEGRHPFLDREIVDFVTELPDKYKLKGTNEKYIVKKAAEGIVPREILKRKKFPFQTPGMSAMVKWSGCGEFLTPEILRKYGVFDPNYVQEMIQAYRQPDFKLMGAYEIDYLLIVMTVTMLCERYGLSL
ncbi:MAG: asparagine synthase (glutamine-hydrolyzing) [Oscillibacter sp.]|nr:asparagine synthase (glutamine-hydrolyzing) [Oscillibacter sp.]